jgi:hypothetical protein
MMRFFEVKEENYWSCTGIGRPAPGINRRLPTYGGRFLRSRGFFEQLIVYRFTVHV